MSNRSFWRSASQAISDVAVVVGCSVGVGFISGKETQLFVGSITNAVIFAVVFCLILFVIRDFCRKHNVTTLSALASKCFPRRSGVFGFVLALCAFVCVTTSLAGVQQCLSEVLPIGNLPVYAILVAAVSAVVLLHGLSALKMFNIISIVMSVLLFVALYVNNSCGNVLASEPKRYMPIAYALFNLTMSLAVVCPLGGSSRRSQNAVRSAVSAAALAAMLLATTAIADFSQPLPTLSGITSPALKVYAVATVVIACVCGVVSCAYPVVEQVNSVIDDKSTSAICVFALAAAFAMFGFDFVVRYGYVFVAVVGAILVATCLLRQRASKAH